MDMIEDAERLREAYGPPSERALKKELRHFDKHCRDFIARSPFLVIASSDRSGRCDASPKGDAPGFVEVIDDQTLLIPDRLGNNRVDTLGNLLARPGIGLIFFVPGINETLRVNGRARITSDLALLEPLAVNGKVPRSGILVSADEIYFHCGKALIRSDLWNPQKYIRRSDFPSLGEVLTEQIGGVTVGEPDRLERYKTRLY
jgi:PPOX class probable FMN-dependent enzyme